MFATCGGLPTLPDRELPRNLLGLTRFELCLGFIFGRCYCKSTARAWWPPCIARA